MFNYHQHDIAAADAIANMFAPLELVRGGANIITNAGTLVEALEAGLNYLSLTCGLHFGFLLTSP